MRNGFSLQKIKRYKGMELGTTVQVNGPSFPFDLVDIPIGTFATVIDIVRPHKRSVFYSIKPGLWTFLDTGNWIHADYLKLPATEQEIADAYTID